MTIIFVPLGTPIEVHPLESGCSEPLPCWFDPPPLAEPARLGRARVVGASAEGGARGGGSNQHRGQKKRGAVLYTTPRPLLATPLLPSRVYNPGKRPCRLSRQSGQTMRPAGSKNRQPSICATRSVIPRQHGSLTSITPLQSQHVLRLPFDSLCRWGEKCLGRPPCRGGKERREPIPIHPLSNSKAARDCGSGT